MAGYVKTERLETRSSARQPNATAAENAYVSLGTDSLVMGESESPRLALSETQLISSSMSTFGSSHSLDDPVTNFRE